MNRTHTTATQKIYSYILVLLPVLCQYQWGPLDLDVIVMLAFFGAWFIYNRKLIITPVGKRMLVIIGYILITSLVNLAVGDKFSPSGDIILRTGRYCLYLIIVFFLGNELYSYRSLMGAFKVVAYAATVYVILQTVVFYSTGYILPHKIGGPSLTESGEIGRFRAFYSEPSNMAYALIPFIVCSLFGKQDEPESNKNTVGAFFVTVGIVLSTTGQGIVSVAIVWALWLLSRIKNRKLTARELLLIICIIAAVAVLYNVGILEYALNRINHTNEGGAIDARTSGYVALKLLSPGQLLFGTGYGNYIVENSFYLDVFYETIYYSSLAELLFTMGIFGTLLWLGLFTYIYRRSTVCGKVLMVPFAVLAISGCPMTGTFFPIWLTMMCGSLPEGLFSLSSDPQSRRAMRIQ